MKNHNFTLLAGAILGVMLVSLPHRATAAPVLLVNYRFDGNALDDTGNSPSMQLYNTSFVSNTLFMPVDRMNWHQAEARITGFSYNSFTVAVDFNPVASGDSWQTILSGGPAYRWIGFNTWNGHLQITLNGRNWVLDFPDAPVETNRWHSLVCSVSFPLHTLRASLDGAPLPEVDLQNYQLEVIGTEDEDSDKVFGFVNHGNGSAFHGFADNLMVFNRALTAAEIVSLLSPRVNCVPAGSILLVHWPVDLNGYVLQATPAFSATNLWTTVTTQPVMIGGQITRQPGLGATVGADAVAHSLVEAVSLAASHRPA